MAAAEALKEILSGSLTTLSPEAIYAQRQAAFNEALAAGRTAEMPELGKALLEASRAYNASGTGYVSDFTAVTNALANIAGMAGSPTLAAAEKQIQILTDIQTALEAGNNIQLTLLTALLASGTPLANSLNSYAVGSSYVPYDMTANIHQGEMIIDQASANVLRNYGIPSSGAADNRELIDEVKALRTEIADMKRQTVDKLTDIESPLRRVAAR
jgi:hypothetical protein